MMEQKDWRDPTGVDLLEGCGRELLSALDTPQDRKQALDERLAELVHDTPIFNEYLSEAFGELVPWQNAVYDRKADGTCKRDQFGRMAVSQLVRKTSPEAESFMQALRGRDKAAIANTILTAYDAVMKRELPRVRDLLYDEFERGAKDCHGWLADQEAA
ncbi:MAG: hypothetical protein ABF296_08180 [Oceanococcaceae bacterium]